MYALHDIDISNEHLISVGKISANWSLLEFKIGRAIAEILGTDHKKGRVITCSMTVPSKLNALKLFGISSNWDDKTMEGLKTLSKQINDARVNRNIVIHGLWAQDEKEQYFMVKYIGESKIKGEPIPMDNEALNKILKEIYSASIAFERWFTELSIAIAK